MYGFVLRCHNFTFDLLIGIFESGQLFAKSCSQTRVGTRAIWILPYNQSAYSLSNVINHYAVQGKLHYLRVLENFQFNFVHSLLFYSRVCYNMHYF